MGIFESIQSAMGGEGNKGDVMSSVMDMVSKQGSLGGLVEQFTNKGMGAEVKSWVSTGKNLPISAEQIQSVLGSEHVKGIANKLGIDSNTVSAQLANVLPMVIDKLTPNGKVPEGDDLLSKGKDLLGGFFGK